MWKGKKHMVLCLTFVAGCFKFEFCFYYVIQTDFIKFLLPENGLMSTAAKDTSQNDLKS